MPTCRSRHVPTLEYGANSVCVEKIAVTVQHHALALPCCTADVADAPHLSRCAKRQMGAVDYMATPARTRAEEVPQSDTQTRPAPTLTLSDAALLEACSATRSSLRTGGFTASITPQCKRVTGYAARTCAGMSWSLAKPGGQHRC